MKREFRLPTILGVFVAISGLVAGLVLVGYEVRRSASASAGEVPSDVRISNVSDSAFTVSWTTAVATSGFVKYGPVDPGPDLVVSDERDLTEGNIGNYFTHYVTVRGLSGAHDYVFNIGSGKGTYDQLGNLYQVKTGATIADTPAADVAYGQVGTGSGEPVDGAILYIEMENAAPISALTKSSGSWVASLATARTKTLDAYLTYDKQTSSLRVLAVDGKGGTGQAVTTTAEDSPMPAIVMEQGGATAFQPVPTIDPNAGSDVVATDSATSKLSDEVTGIVLLSPKFGERAEGNPEIVGRAPANTQVTIEIHSETPIKTTVVSDADGNFSFDVPSNLAPGEHTVTITALINGVTRTITRSFVVLAAEDQFGTEFSASPSASPTVTIPTPTRTPGITPTIAPVATTFPTATPLPTVMPETTDTILPVTGDAEWTWLVFGLGGVFVLGGMAVLAL